MTDKPDWADEIVDQLRQLEWTGGRGIPTWCAKDLAAALRKEREESEARGKIKTARDCADIFERLSSITEIQLLRERCKDAAFALRYSADDLEEKILKSPVP